MSNINQTQLAELINQFQLQQSKHSAIPVNPKVGLFTSICNAITKVIKISLGIVIIGTLGYIAWHSGVKKLIKSPQKAEIEFKERQIEKNMRDIATYDQHRIAEKQGLIEGTNKYRMWLTNRIDSVINNVGNSKVVEFDHFKSAGLPIQPQIMPNEPMPFVPMPDNPFTHKIISKQMAKPHKIVSLPAPPDYKATIQENRAIQTDKIADLLKEHELKQAIKKAGE